MLVEPLKVFLEFCSIYPGKKSQMLSKKNNDSYEEELLYISKIKENFTKRDLAKFVEKFNHYSSDKILNLFTPKKISLDMHKERFYWNFLGIYKLDILTPDDTIYLEVKLDKIYFNPKIETIELDFSFYNNFKSYNPFESPYLDTFSNLLNALREAGELDSKNFIKKNRYSNLKRNRDQYYLTTTNFKEKCSNCFKYFKITIWYNNKPYIISYKMDLTVGNSSAWSTNQQFTELVCQNFTILTKQEIEDLMNDYYSFLNNEADIFNEDLVTDIHSLQTKLNLKDTYPVLLNSEEDDEDDDEDEEDDNEEDDLDGDSQEESNDENNIN